MRKDDMLQVRTDAGYRTRLDALRKAEPDLPTRSEMVRRLIDRAADALPRRQDR